MTILFHVLFGEISVPVLPCGWPSVNPSFRGAYVLSVFRTYLLCSCFSSGGLAPEKRTQSILGTGCAFLVGPGLASEESNESRKNRTVKVEGGMRRCRTNAPMCVSRCANREATCVCLVGLLLGHVFLLGSCTHLPTRSLTKLSFLTLTRPCSVLCRTLV